MNVVRADKPHESKRPEKSALLGSQLERPRVTLDVHTPPLLKAIKPRGRPRRFDKTEVLLRIRRCFSQGGYAGTSVDDLSRATGLAKPSLYGAFGDKRAMFLSALDSEAEELSARLNGMERTGPLASRLAAFLRAASSEATEGQAETFGGIAFGAALADMADDPEVRRRLQHTHRIIDAAAKSTLDAHGSPAAVRWLSALAVALCVRSRSASISVKELDMSEIALFLEPNECPLA